MNTTEEIMRRRMGETSFVIARQTYSKISKADWRMQRHTACVGGLFHLGYGMASNPSVL